MKKKNIVVVQKSKRTIREKVKARGVKSVEKTFKEIQLENEIYLINRALDLRVSSPIPTARGATSIEGMNRIEFLEFDAPRVTAGTYQLSIEQNTSGAGATRYSKNYTIKIDAPQYRLAANDIHSVYPPNNSKGKYLDTLPHITLNRTTLPWERKYFRFANGEAENASWKFSWLGLFLFSEAEAPKILKMKAKDFGFQLEENNEDELNYIEISKDLLYRATPFELNLADPTKPLDDSFPYLSHVKADRKANQAVKETDKKSVIICNRFPIRGTTNVVHLVALEKNPLENNRFVSLHNWSFYCEDKINGFEDILKAVNVAPLALTHNNQTNPYLKNGFVPMGHHLRRGEKTVSWYHSPLVPYESQFKYAAYNSTNYADKLLTLDTASNLLDISYATAWQLGRTLTLREKDVAIAIYNFYKKSKRQHSYELLKSLNLQISKKNPEEDVPLIILQWLRDLYDLKNIPFNYLVPHADMLPMESMRFFRIDTEWLKHCVSGAFSIGLEMDTEENPPETTNIEIEPDQYTGFIIRSKVIADYPDLLFEGSTALEKNNDNPLNKNNLLPIIVKRKLNKDMLLVIFDGKVESATGHIEYQTVKTVDIFIAPTGLHFGVSTKDADEDGQPEFTKTKRFKDEDNLGTLGEKEETETDISNHIDEHNCLKLSSFSKDYLNAEHDSTQFAFQMLEGTPKVRFYAPE